MKKDKLASAFNKWMDEYINHPERFKHDFESVIKHLEEKEEGKPLTYGDECAAYLIALME